MRSSEEAQAKPEAEKGAASAAWADKLIDVYKIAIDEYRYNVRLNWDRTQYFLGLNLAIVAAATGLVKAQLGFWECALVASLFTCGVIASSVGASACIKGHEYYQASRKVVKAIEAKLGLPAELGIATTGGMRGEKFVEPEPDLGPAGAPPKLALFGNLRRGTVLHGAVVLLRVITALDLAGALYALIKARG
jgi:hypothetical protein